MLLENKQENAERQKTICAGCGKPKPQGLVVCWNCFKYRPDHPLKYFSGSFAEWLKAVNHVR